MSVPDPVLARWADGFAGHEEHAEVLPPHHARCLGCGPENTHGHHLQAWREGDGVHARHVFDDRHVGAPGIVHGGAVATVLDDLYGFLLYVIGDLAVTRHLEVGYRAPVLLDVPYTLGASLDRREGRKLFVRACGTDEQGALVVESTALFIVVGVQHFEGAAT